MRFSSSIENIQLKMKYKIIFFWSFHGHRDGEDHHYLEYKLITSSIILWVFFSVMLQLQLICTLFILFSFFCSGFTTKDVDKEILNRPANRSDSQLLHQHKHRRMNDLHIHIFSPSSFGLHSIYSEMDLKKRCYFVEWCLHCKCFGNSMYHFNCFTSSIYICILNVWEYVS